MPHVGPLLAARAGIGEGSAGGAETQVFLLARELCRRGHRVAIATLETSPSLPEEVEGIEIIALPVRPPGASRTGLLAWGVRFVLALERIDRCAVVQRTAGAITGLAALLARLGGRPFVYSCSGVNDFEYDQLETSPAARGLFGIGRRLARTIVVQSDEQAELCRLRWGRSSTVVRSLAEPAPRRTQPPEAFLWIGRLSPYKRPEIFLELAERMPDATFWVVGSAAGNFPEVDEQIRRRATELANVELLGSRSRTELANLYDRAAAVVNTSRSEGMSNVLLEAWARGVPALMHAHDPDGLVAREGLGWVADGSLDRLTELAEAAWASRDDQADVADRCRSYLAREHLPERVAERWERVLRLIEPLG